MELEDVSKSLRDVGKSRGKKLSNVRRTWKRFITRKKILKMSKIPIEYGNYYHIFNRGNNYEDIFLETEHYEYFLKLYSIYIEPIAETFAWCLLSNHFHFFVKIKEEHEVGYLSAENANNEDLSIKWEVFFPDKPDSNFNKKPNASRMFQHLFNTYARWYNLKIGRINSLFKKEFERKLVDNQDYYRNLIVYINNNPVHHGFVEQAIEYTWSSYKSVLSNSPTKLKRKEIIEVFDDVENFKYIHKQKQDLEKIQDYIIE